jgi:hypothetical protein
LEERERKLRKAVVKRKELSTLNAFAEIDGGCCIFHGLFVRKRLKHYSRLADYALTFEIEGVMYDRKYSILVTHVYPFMYQAEI